MALPFACEGGAVLGDSRVSFEEADSSDDRPRGLVDELLQASHSSPFSSLLFSSKIRAIQADLRREERVALKKTSKTRRDLSDEGTTPEGDAVKGEGLPRGEPSGGRHPRGVSSKRSALQREVLAHNGEAFFSMTSRGEEATKKTPTLRGDEATRTTGQRDKRRDSP